MPVLSRALLVAVLFPLLPSAAGAQIEPSGLQPGARVRLTVADTIDPVTGQAHYVFLRAAVMRAGDTELLLAPDTAAGKDADTLRYAFGRILEGQVFSGRRRQKLRGAALGLAAGAIGGFFVGDAGRKGSQYCYFVGSRRECDWRGGTQDKRPATAAQFGGAGVLLGGAIGHFVLRERWDRIRFAVRYEDAASR